jgi:hypothetical protein
MKNDLEIEESEKILGFYEKIKNLIYLNRYLPSLWNGGLIGIGIYFLFLPLLLNFKELNQKIIYYVR